MKTEDTSQINSETYIPLGSEKGRKLYDLCLLFNATGCSVANALASQLNATTENKIKLLNFLSPPLESQEVANYIESSVSKYEPIQIITNFKIFGRRFNSQQKFFEGFWVGICS